MSIQGPASRANIRSAHVMPGSQSEGLNPHAIILVAKLRGMAEQSGRKTILGIRLASSIVRHNFDFILH